MPLKYKGLLFRASRDGGFKFASWIRRGLLELWAMLMMAGVIGFLGPFGTYLHDDFLSRAATWWALLMGAYVLVRPSILLWRSAARSTSLPGAQLAFWGVAISSVPLAILWDYIGGRAFEALEGFTGLLPFSLLCALAVLGVTWWAERIDAQLSLKARTNSTAASLQHEVRIKANSQYRDHPQESLELVPGPRLANRLPSSFKLPIHALQSEDHYVRVYGAGESELLLMRLRDAIAEMDDVEGEQIHRSWWVAREAVRSVEKAGRTLNLHLKHGTVAPVARESVERLHSIGFLPQQVDARL